VRLLRWLTPVLFVPGATAALLAALAPAPAGLRTA
jgi:hypothetical protein